MAEEKRTFNLAELLSGVSGLDTSSADRPGGRSLQGREQIEYIDLSLIDGDPNNFYELSDIEGLAGNIELIGLQQPLRVRDNPDVPGHVMIVSGHRRRAAVQMAVEGGREDLRQVPCIRDTACENPALQELRLIFANADTRKMSAADISKQIERVEQLLYQLKEDGMEFPGRMRDHVAQACNVSKSKIARLKVIRENLRDCWVPAFESGVMSETVAYAMAQLPTEHQHAIWKYWTSKGKEIKYLYEGTVKSYGNYLSSIDKLRCKSKDPCINAENKFLRIAEKGYDYCACSSRCCKDCPELVSCRFACPKLNDKVKKLKERRKEDRKTEKERQEAADRPVIEQIKDIWNRFGQARNAADVSVCALFRHLGRYYFGDEDQKYVKKECLEGDFTTQTELPFGYDIRLNDVNILVKTAQLFGCSTDYLLGLSDQMKGGPSGTPVPTEGADEAAPAIQGAVWYGRDVEPPAGPKIVVVTGEGWAEDNRYAGGGYLDEEGVTKWKEVIAWTFMPQNTLSVSCADSSPKGRACGWMPGTAEPEEPVDALAYFTADGLENPLRKIAHWNGSAWCFPGGASIDAACIKWYPLPPEDDM